VDRLSKEATVEVVKAKQKKTDQMFKGIGEKVDRQGRETNKKIGPLPKEPRATLLWKKQKRGKTCQAQGDRTAWDFPETGSALNKDTLMERGYLIERRTQKQIGKQHGQAEATANRGRRGATLKKSNNEDEEWNHRKIPKDPAPY